MRNPGAAIHRFELVAVLVEALSIFRARPKEARGVELRDPHCDRSVFDRCRLVHEPVFGTDDR